MKRLSLLLFLLLSISELFGQSEAEKFKTKVLSNKNLSNKELKTNLTKYDFSKLFLHTDNSVIYGFIGDNYQRIRVKLITVIKDTSLPNTYHVYGKSMVKNNVDQFTGTIKISTIRKLKSISYGVDNEYKNKGIKGEYTIIADYIFSKNKDQPHSGFFKGISESDFYIDKSYKVRYDDIDLNADGYTNNQFIGEWKDYKTNVAKRCNWGDFRIPNSDDFDIGAGEFSPDDKYLKYGWQSRRDYFLQGSNYEKAKSIENSKWWE